MYKSILALIFLLTCQMVVGQKIYTKSGDISFTSKAIMETIEAKHDNAVCVIDIETGAMEWSAAIKGFKFKKKLMEEHFNENYMESDKYPNASFKGEFVSDVDWSLSGLQDVRVKGILEIHGVQQEIEVPAQLNINDSTVEATTQFIVKTADYGIKIPKVVRNNVAKEVNIDVQVRLEKL